MKVKKFFSEKWKRYKRSKRWWNIVLDFTFLILIVLMLYPSTRRSLSAFVVRQTLTSPKEASRTLFLSENDWEFSFYSYEGELVSLNEKRGKPIFINYWATWCPPCIAELPSVQNLYDRYNENVSFVFVSNEEPEKVISFMENRAYNFPVYQLIGTVPELFESSILPTTFIISPAGRLVLFKTGAAKWDSKRVIKMMDELVKEVETR